MFAEIVALTDILEGVRAGAAWDHTDVTDACTESVHHGSVESMLGRCQPVAQQTMGAGEREVRDKKRTRDVPDRERVLEVTLRLTSIPPTPKSWA